MNYQNFIQFNRKRDLGTILSDTFKFLSIEWKPLFITILRVAIIPILVAICAMVYYIMSFTTLFGSLAQSSNPDILFESMTSSEILYPVLAFSISYLVAYSLMTVSAMSYIKSYIVNNGLVNYEEISNLTKNKFWSYVGLFFLNGLIVTFGTMFCFLPGIYFGVVLSLSTCLLLFQNKSVTDAISDSFSFIKNHWWETFGILIVVYLINLFVSFIVGLPASLYQSSNLVESILQNENPDEILNIFSDPIYISLLVFSYFVNFMIYIIWTVILVFIYYDIKEQKNPSTDIIDKIGAE